MGTPLPGLNPFRQTASAAPAKPFGDTRVAIVGTSLVQHNTHLVSGAINYLGNWSRGWMSWAQVLDPRMRYDIWLDAADLNGRGFSGANHGVSGQTCQDILGRLDRVIRMRPSVVILDLGTNDVGSIAKEAIQEARVRAVERLRRARIFVLLLPILARSVGTTWTAGSSARKQAQWINQASKNYADATPGVVFCDWNDGWVDPVNANGEPVAGFSDDGTHFSVLGAYAVAKKVVSVLSPLLPPSQPRIVAREDTFDATGQPARLADDQSPDDRHGRQRRHRRDGECCRRYARRTRRRFGLRRNDINGAKGRSRLLATPLHHSVGPGRRDLLSPAIGHGNSVPAISDSWWRGSCDVALSAYSGWRGCELHCNLYAGASASGMAIGLEAYKIGSAWQPMPSEAWTGTIMTPPFQLPAGTDRVRFRLEASIDGSVSGSPVLDLGSFALRQVADGQLPVGTLVERFRQRRGPGCIRNTQLECPRRSGIRRKCPRRRLAAQPTFNLGTNLVLLRRKPERPVRDRSTEG